MINLPAFGFRTSEDFAPVALARGRSGWPKN